MCGITDFMIYLIEKLNMRNNIKIFIITLLMSCNIEKKSIDIDKTFGFKTLTDEYDYSKGIFIRRYNDSIVLVDIILNNEEKEEIKKLFVENYFLELPQKIDCSKMGVKPEINDKIYWGNKRVNYIHNMEDRLFCMKGKRFDRIKNGMMKIILNKKEIRDLEYSDIFYE